MKTDRKRR